MLHISPALFTSDGGIVGGGERYALELARYMARETPTTLVAFGDRDRSLTIDGLPVRVIGSPWYVRGQRNNPIAAALLGELRKADVVHCHQRHVLASSLAALACRLSGRRVFVTDHGGGGWDISAYISTDRWYHNHLHVSEYSRMLSGHADRPFAQVIFGGVDIDKFSPAPSLTPRTAILFVGRILPHKGINYLIEAMPCDRELIVAGPVCDERFLADLHRLAAGKRVRFRHDCDDAALVDYYRAARCVVLPSVYHSMYGETTTQAEFLGQTLLEGMACGAPVICTAVGGMPEVVEDRVTGFVVPPNDPAALGDRIRWLFTHPAEADAIGAAGRCRVLEKFTWPQVVRRCLEIYAAAAPHSARAPVSHSIQSHSLSGSK